MISDDVPKHATPPPPDDPAEPSAADRAEAERIKAAADELMRQMRATAARLKEEAERDEAKRRMPRGRGP